MRALVIAPQPFFSPRGTPFSVYYRTLVIAEAGVRVDILTYGQGQDVRIPGARIIRIPNFRFLGAVHVGPSRLKAFLDVVMVVWTVGLLLRHRYDYVHAHEEAAFWCRFLAPLFRVKLAYDMHSRLPQQLTNFGFSDSKLLSGIFTLLERSSLKRSDAVITICPALRDYVLAQGVDPHRHFLIENSLFDDVELATGTNGDEEPTAAISGADGPRIVYAGTFEPYQGVELLVEAFARVRVQHRDAELVLIGGTEAQRSRLKALAEECHLNGSCVFSGSVGRKRVKEHLAVADVVVSPRRAGTNTPLKIYEQLASGRPLVATRIAAHTQVLTDEVCFLVDPTPESLADGILAALGDRELAQRKARAAGALYDTAYARELYESKVHAFLEVLR